MKQTIKTFLALLVMIVTSATGWAQTKTITYLNYDGTNKVFEEATNSFLPLTSTSDDLSGMYYVEGTVSISRMLTLAGITHIVLCDDAELNIENTDGKGIDAAGVILTIYAQSSGDHAGKLTINSKNEAFVSSDITIHGGIVSATSESKDGICCGSLTIHGGQVDATGSAGIRSYIGTTINGGKVTATGSDYGICCGGGGFITIYGGQVTAIGSSSGISENDFTVLGWKNATDFIWASSYKWTVKTASGKGFNYEGGGLLTADHSLSDTEKNNIACKTLTPKAETTPNTITVASGITGGTVEVDRNKAFFGERVAVTITPAAGMMLSALSYNDGASTYTIGTGTNDIKRQVNDYVITMPAADITVSATFTPLPLILQSNLTNADVTFYKSATKPTAASIEALTDADIVDEADAGEYVVMHIEPYYGGATGYYWTDEALLYGTDAGASLAPRRAEAQRRAPSVDLPLEVKLLKRDTYTEEDDEDNLQTYTKYNGAGWYYYQIPTEHSVASGYKFSLIDGFVPKRFALNSWDDDIVFQNENVVTITDGTDGGWSAEVTVDELNFKFDGEEHAPNITKIIIKKGTDTYIELTDAARIENLLKPDKTKEIGPNTIFAAANNYCWFRGYCWDAEFNITMPFDGSGTEDDPWKIETADDLNMFAKCVNVGKYNFWAKYLMQTKDIDMSGINDFRSIGYMDERSFMGSFDGNNKTISNLKVNMTVMYSEELDVEFSDFRPVFVGLFGGVGKGIVRNVTLRNSSINYQSDCCSDYVGGIAGLCAGLIENCTVDGCTISAKTTVPDNPTADGPELTNAVGGIVGGTYKYLEIAAKQRRAPGDEPSPVVGMPNLFHNRVIGNTTISSETNNNTDCPVGAIAGFVTIGTYEKTTLYDNKYAYNVKLYQKNGTKAVTSQKYTQRGTIEYDGYYDTEKHEFIEIYSDLKDITENEGAMMDAHLVTLTTNSLAGYDMAQAGLTHSSAPATDWTVGTNCYQKDESGHPYIAAEDQVNLNVASTITRENDGRTYYADLALALNGKVLSGTSFTMPAEDVNVTATYTEANWFTIDTNEKAWMSFYHEWMTGGDAAASVAANYTVSDPDQKKAIELLTISDVNSKTGTYNTADLNGISYSGVPTLLHAKDGVLPEKLKFVPVADKTAPRYADDYFKGVTEKTDFRTGVYILNAVGDFIYAEPSENDHTLAAHRCYIDLNGNPTAGAPLRLGENDATAVEDLSIVNSQLSTFNSDEWYTLSGVKLEGEPTVKGIYIYNGKKVVIK